MTAAISREEQKIMERQTDTVNQGSHVQWRYGRTYIQSELLSSFAKKHQRIKK